MLKKLTLKKRINSDDGLMGTTHALSALAISLLLAWLASDFMFNKLIGSTDSVVFVTAIIIIIGASLMPDLDAVKSTSINTLGVIGSLLSKIMRGFSSIVQNLIKGPSDKSSDPHRGFWHTPLAAILVGLGITGLTSIDKHLFTVADAHITVATLIVFFIIYISVQLMVASLLSFINKKSKKNLLSQIITQLVCLVFSLTLLYFLPPNLDYKWVGAVVSFGWIIHILGDMITVSGVPLLFPLKYRGKRWWDFRLPLGVKAGGFFEKAILMPIFAIIVILSIIKIFPLIM